jgi:hypothetical protein
MGVAAILTLQFAISSPFRNNKTLLFCFATYDMTVVKLNDPATQALCVAHGYGDSSHQYLLWSDECQF